MRGRTFGSVNAGVPFGKSMFKASTTDPRRRVTKCTDGGRWEVTGEMPIPSAAQAITSMCRDSEDEVAPDSTILIYDEANDRAATIRRWSWNGGNPLGSTSFYNSLKGLGHPGTGEGRIGPSASGMMEVLGIIRGHEVNTPGTPIEHVLQLTMDRFGNNAFLDDAYVWPAVDTDGSCSRGRKEDGVLDCSGPIPYGQLLAIPQNINVEALPLSEPGRRLARALQRYGARPTDGTGTGVNMRADQMVSVSVRRQLEEDMKRHLLPLLRAVLNDAKDQQASGGGNPIAPNCAVDAQ